MFLQDRVARNQTQPHKCVKFANNSPDGHALPDRDGRIKRTLDFAYGKRLPILADGKRRRGADQKRPVRLGVAAVDRLAPFALTQHPRNPQSRLLQVKRGNTLPAQAERTLHNPLRTRRHQLIDHFFPFVQLQSWQSICPFSNVVCPPLHHGLTWSACISSSANFLPQSGQTPPCF